MPIILMTLALLFCAILLSPYPTTVFLAICLAFLTSSSFEKLKSHFSPTRAVSIFIAILVFAIFLPVSIVISMVTPQVINGAVLLQRWRNTGWEIPKDVQHYLDLFEGWFIDFPEFTSIINDFNQNFEEFVNTVISYVLTSAVGLAGNLVNYIWQLFLFVVLSTLCVVYAKHIKQLADGVLRLKDGMLDRFIETIQAALRSVVMGILLVALFQGIACTVGFILFKVPEPLFWGLLSCLVAPIPFVGTALIWGPLSVVLWLTVSPTMGIALVVWGMLVVAAIDNFLRPYFLSTGIKAPFFVLLLSILCGLAVFGTVGLITGPMLVALALQCIAETSRLVGIELPETLRIDVPSVKEQKKSLRNLKKRSKNTSKPEEEIQ